jgi:hypothetical protein
MSYTSDLKSTLSGTPILTDSSPVAELYGFLHSAGSLSFLGKGKIKLSFSCDNASVARRYFSIIKELFGYSAHLYIKKSSSFKKNTLYFIDFEDDSMSLEILSFYKIFDPYDMIIRTEIDNSFLNSKLMQYAYLKGIFLGCGYISSPSKSYHLELNINHAKRAKHLVSLLKRNNIKANYSTRQEYCSVYIKRRESIATFLGIIGANKAVFDFENIFIIKDIRNDTVRLVNSETANINKTINSAELQIAAIQKIARTKGLDYLNDKLKEAAYLRLTHPSAPLSEICEYFSPKISRTAAFNRYSQIKKIADDL